MKNSTLGETTKRRGSVHVAAVALISIAALAGMLLGDLSLVSGSTGEALANGVDPTGDTGSSGGSVGGANFAEARSDIVGWSVTRVGADLHYTATTAAPLNFGKRAPAPPVRWNLALRTDSLGVWVQRAGGQGAIGWTVDGSRELPSNTTQVKLEGSASGPVGTPNCLESVSWFQNAAKTQTTIVAPQSCVGLGTVKVRFSYSASEFETSWCQPSCIEDRDTALDETAYTPVNLGATYPVPTTLPPVTTTLPPYQYPTTTVPPAPPAQAGAQPLASVENISVSGNQIRFSGWAFDSERTRPVVLITVNGQWVWMPVVNVWRPDLWNFFRRTISEHSGWAGAIEAAPGTHSVCAHVADAVTPNKFRVIDCKKAVVK
jgi:hypothetical protein